jgi:ferredoxin-type protein NapH
MSQHTVPGRTVREKQGWLRANRWLLLRRLSQFGILALFLAGPWFGVWIVQGSLSASMTLDVLPLTDPLLLLQSMLSGSLPVLSGVVGALIVIACYALVGGRVFCAWVCPVNPVTDLAEWLRRRLDLRAGVRLSRDLRYWMLGLVLLLPLVTGTMAFESLNPVTMTQRGLVFGLGLAWLVLAGVFLFDLLVARHGWCGHLCPIGAGYGLIGRFAPLRVRADRRAHCDDCLDCFAVCPEPQVIKPALKGAAKGLGPVILDMNCTNCGRCLDVCPEGVFRFGPRWRNHDTAVAPNHPSTHPPEKVR